MIRAQVEYVGFNAEIGGRSYRLRVSQASGEFLEYSLLIAHDAFVSHRVRYQDAPEICYLKLQRDLAAGGEPPVPFEQTVTDAELDAYRMAHAAKPPLRRSLAT
jgi:hypothetical protein